MIELTRASFQYENSDRGVQDISLSVKGGECVVLTGLSGCGKTTVTRLVNGLAPSYYNGLTLEQFLWAWCKTNFLLAGRRLWHSENYLYDLWEKEDKK